MEFFNSFSLFHQTIKFDEPQHNNENNSCEFLDLKISIENGKIATDLFRKDTEKPRALLLSSAHPGHITTNIVYSMAFRLIIILKLLIPSSIGSEIFQEKTTLKEERKPWKRKKRRQNKDLE